jgi:hypothetical protein
MSLLDQVARDRQAGRTAAHNRDPTAGRTTDIPDFEFPLLSFPIGDEAFEAADSDLPSFLDQSAGRLALFLLRADASADGREAIFFLHYSYAAGEIALGHAGDKSRDVDFYGTEGNAFGFLALRTAFRLFNSRLGGISESYFAEIVTAHHRRLLGHLASLIVDFFPLRFLHLKFLRFKVMMLASAGSKGNCFFSKVGFSALEKLLPIDLVAVEIWAVNTGEPGFASYRNPAHPAHSRTINHYRIQTGNGLNAQRPAGFGTTLEKIRASIYNQAIDLLPVCLKNFRKPANMTFIAFGPVSSDMY